MSDALKALQAEVAQFRAWADATYPDTEWRGGEWEANYNGWDRLYEAFAAFVSSTSRRDWDAATTEMLLYAIARDNEIEDLVGEVALNPGNLVCLAERALESREWDAKWQIAQALSEMEPRPPEVESLLLRFARDEDEYVRRTALMALSHINSPHVAGLVGPAWDTGDEYQRIAVLCSLDEVNSPLLADYAARAEADGRASLAEYAAYIRENGTLRGFTIQGIPVVNLY